MLTMSIGYSVGNLSPVGLLIFFMLTINLMLYMQFICVPAGMLYAAILTVFVQLINFSYYEIWIKYRLFPHSSTLSKNDTIFWIWSYDVEENNNITDFALLIRLI